jgi:uncharacterized integral membrane protein
MAARNDARADGIGGVSYRTLVSALLLLLVVLFIVMNRDETDISFVLFDAQTALWVALTVAAGLGFIAGFLAGRRGRRY